MKLGRHDRHQVRQHEGIDVLAERIGQDGDDHAQKAAVERHAAFPDDQDLQRMGQEVARLIEEDVAQPSAQDDTERRPQEEVVDLGRRQEQGRFLADAAHDAPSDHQARDVGERVPADGERPELDQHRIDLRIGDKERGHGRPGL
jgi:hypothetical protein